MTVENAAPPQTMRVAIGQLAELTHHDLTFACQIGASGVQLNTPIIPGSASRLI